jgi:hypothetical protein
MVMRMELHPKPLKGFKEVLRTPYREGGHPLKPLREEDSPLDSLTLLFTSFDLLPKEEV